MSIESSAEQPDQVPAREASVSDAWAEYFTGPVQPEGGVNWDAYSHDELYQMLWQDADVADVGAVATEWAKHRVALTTHAQVLREQSAALQDSWQGQGADEAARRLEVLAARVEKIGELAAAGEQAAQEAANGLAMARAMMPPPPGNPAAPLTDATACLWPAGSGWAGTMNMGMGDVPVPVAPSSPSLSSLQSYMSSMQSYLSSMQAASAANFAAMMSWTPAGMTAGTPTGWASPGMGTAFGAVGASGMSFYSGGTAMDEQKAQAVRAMQTYESSLNNGSQLITQARGAVPPAASMPRAAEPTAPVTAAVPGARGVPWQRLVSAAPVGGLRAGAVPGAPGLPGEPGSPGVARGMPLGPGARAGALPGAPAAQLAEAATARSVVGQGAMVPPVAGQRGAGADEDSHENRMPTVDHRLFDVDEPVIPGVIGQDGVRS